MKKNHLRLGVNIDHVATIRNARGGAHPSPLTAANMVQDSTKADGITVHLREDRRHITNNDLEQLKKNIRLPINLELAPVDEMLKTALQIRPNAVCFVPEKRQEITTEGGLDIIPIKSKLKDYIKELKQAGIRSSLFIEASMDQIIAAKEVGADIVEFHTGKYAHVYDDNEECLKELTKIEKAAKFADETGLEVHAGHGLNFYNVSEIARIPQIKELNIGHFLIGEAIFVGLASAVTSMIEIMKRARG